MKKLSYLFFAIIGLFLFTACSGLGGNPGGGGNGDIVNPDQEVCVVIVYGYKDEIIDKLEVKRGERIDPEMLGEAKAPNGLVFSGWDFDFSMPIEHDVKIVAKFEKRELLIEFITGTDEKLKPIRVKPGEIVKLPELHKEGYSFDGFMYDGNIYNKEMVFSFDHSIVLKAVWTKLKEEKLILHYELNGGANNEQNPAEAALNSEIFLYPALKDGYKFLGWYLEPEFINRVDSVTITKEHTTFYAKFSNGLEITYNLNGGTNNEKNPTSLGFNKTHTLLDAKMKDSYFLGWWDNEAFEGEPIKELLGAYEGEISLYARFIKNKIKLTAKLNDNDNTIMVFELLPGESYDLSQFSREGYYLDNITINGEAIDSFGVFNYYEDVVAEFNWRPKENYINYRPFEGSFSYNNPNPTYYLTESEVVLLPAEYVGYSFEGWYTDPDYTQKIEKITKDMTGSIELYPKFSPATYKITYEFPANIGAKNPNPAEVTYPNNLGLVGLDVVGYYFLGWYLDGEQVNYIMPNRDITLVAKLEAIKITISYNIPGLGANSFLATYDSPIEIPEITHPGYNISGYTIGGIEYKSGDICKLYSDTTLKLIESPIVYKINYHLEPNMSFGQDKAIYEFTALDGYFNLPRVFINNIEFSGYALAKDDTSQTIRGIGPNNKEDLHDFDLYPVFYKKQYTLTLISNYTSKEIKVCQNEELILEEPTNIPEGYVFDCWMYEETKFDAKYYPFNHNAKLVASFKKKSDNKIMINYHLPEGAENSLDNPVYLGEAIQKLAPAFKKGYRFDGWYETENFSHLTEYALENLYPSFIPNWYTVRFRYKNTIIDTYELQSGNSIDLASYEIYGYTINGFYLNGESFTCDSYDYGMDIIVDLDMTLVEHSITYDTAGGSLEDMPTAYNYASYINLKDPKKEGYKFIGWYTDSGDRIFTINGERNDQDIKLTAKYEIITYKVIYETPSHSSSLIREFTVEDEITLTHDTVLDSSFAEFEGFYLDGVKIEKINKGTTGDLHLTIKYGHPVYHGKVISANPNFKQLEFDYKLGDYLSLPEAERIKGYSFVEYRFNGEKIEKFDEAQRGGCEIEAVYELINYELIIQSYGDERIIANDNPKTFTILDNIILKPVVFEGEDFAYFVDYNTGLIITEINACDRPIILFAHSKYRTFEVTINYNDGSPEEVIATSSYPFNFLLAPRREGYSFLGFVEVKKDGNEFIDENYLITSNTRIEAVWEKDATHTITLNAEGLANNKLLVRPGEVVALPRLSNNGNKVFTGWSYNDNGNIITLADEFIYRFGTDITVSAIYVDVALDFEYIEENGGITINKYLGTSNSIRIPDTINDKPVIHIASDIVDEIKDEIYLGANVVTASFGALDNFKYININKKFNPKHFWITENSRVSNRTIEVNHNFDLFAYRYEWGDKVIVNYDSSFENVSLFDTLFNSYNNPSTLDISLRGFKKLDINDIMLVKLLDEELVELTGTNIDINRDSNAPGEIHVKSLEHWLRVKKSDILDKYNLFVNGKKINEVKLDKEIVEAYALSGLCCERVIISSKATVIEDYALANMQAREFILLSNKPTSLGEVGSCKTEFSDAYYVGSYSEFDALVGEREFKILVVNAFCNAVHMSNINYEYDLVGNTYVYNLMFKDRNAIIIDLETDFKGYEIKSFKDNPTTPKLNCNVLILHSSMEQTSLVMSDIERRAPSIRLVLGTDIYSVNGFDGSSGRYVVYDYVKPDQAKDLKCVDYNGYRLLPLPNGNNYVIDVLKKQTSYNLALDLEQAPVKVNMLAGKIFNSLEVDELTIPGSIKSIPNLDISETHGLRKLVLEEGVEELADFALKDVMVDDAYIPNSLKNIDVYGLECKRLHVSSIDEIAKMDTINIFRPENPEDGLYVNDKLVTELVFDHKLTVHTHSFCYIPSITKVVINYPITLEGKAFDLYNLKTVEVKDLDTWLAISANGNNIIELNKFAKLFIGGQELSDTLTIPNAKVIKEAGIVREMGIKNLILEGSCELHKSYQAMGVENVYIENLTSYLSTIVADPINRLSFNEHTKLFIKNKLGEYELLKKLVINEEASISDYLFTGYEYLEEILINKTVMHIGKNAFNGCKNLVKLDSALNVPVYNIYDEAFKELNNLAICNLYGTATFGSKAFYNCDKLKFKLPATASEIGYAAFYGVRVEELDINEALSMAQSNAFLESDLHRIKISHGYTGKTLTNTSFGNNYIDVELGRNLKEIPYHVLDLIHHIGHFDVQMPEVTAFDAKGRYLHGLFSPDLTICYFATNGTEIPIETREIRHNIRSTNGEAEIYYNGTEKDLEKIKNNSLFSQATVKYISPTLKYNISFIDGVLYQSINDELKIIVSDITQKEYNFVKYNDKTKATITNMGRDAEIVHLPMGFAGSNLFVNHEHIKEVILPDNTTEIPANMFLGSSLERITLPAGLKKISRYAFENCKNLKSIVLPLGVEVIEQYAFRDSGIEEITIPTSLKTFAEDAFINTDIKKINVTSLDDYIKSSFENERANPAKATTKFYVNGEYQSFMSWNSEAKNYALIGDVDYLYLDSSVSFYKVPNSTFVLINADSYQGVQVIDPTSIKYHETDKFKYIEADNTCYGLLFKAQAMEALNVLDTFDGLKLGRTHQNIFDELNNLRFLGYNSEVVADEVIYKLERRLEDVYTSFNSEFTYVETPNISYFENINRSNQEKSAIDIKIINPELEIYSETVEIKGYHADYTYNNDAFKNAPKLKLAQFKHWVLYTDELIPRGVLVLGNDVPSGFLGAILHPDINEVILHEDDFRYYELKSNDSTALYIDSLINKEIKEINFTKLESKYNAKVFNIPNRLLNNLALDKLVFPNSAKNYGTDIITGSTITYLDKGNLDSEDKLGDFISIDTFRGKSLQIEKVATSARRVILEDGAQANLYNSNSIKELYLTYAYLDNISLPNLEYFEARDASFNRIVEYNKNVKTARFLESLGSNDKPIPINSIEVLILDGSVSVDVSRFNNLKIVVANEYRNAYHSERNESLLVIVQSKEISTQPFMARCDRIVGQYNGYRIIENEKYKYLTLNEQYSYLIECKDKTSLRLDLATDFAGIDIRGIGVHALDGCSVEELILPNTLKDMHDEIFRGLNLKSVIIPSSIEEINENVFENMNLDYLRLDVNTIFTGDFSTLINCNVKNLEIVGTKIKDSTNLTKYSYIRSIDTLNISADTIRYVSDFNELNTVNITSGTELNISFNIEGAKKVIIPDTITDIKKFIVTSIEELEIPSSVRRIHDRAFYATNIREINLPEGLLEIGEEAFASSKLVRATVPSSVKVIKTRAFKSEYLEEVVLAEGIEEIQFEAFDSRRLSLLRVPASVKIMDSQTTFAGVLNIRRLEGFENYHIYTNGDSYMFDENVIMTPELKEKLRDRNVIYADAKSIEHIETAKYSYDVADTKHVFNLKLQGFNEVYNLPEELPGLIVTRIKDISRLYTTISLYLTEDFTDIDTTQVIYIKELHFASMESIAKLNEKARLINDFTKLFVGDKELTDLVIENIEVVEAYMYSGIKRLNSITIGKGVRVVKQYAFDDPYVNTLVVYGNVDLIEDYAFKYNSIATLIVKSGVKSIGTLSAETMIIPNTLTRVSVGYDYKTFYFDGTKEEGEALGLHESLGMAYYNTKVETIEHIENDMYSYDLINGTEAYNLIIKYTKNGSFKLNQLGENIKVMGINQNGLDGVFLHDFEVPTLKDCSKKLKGSFIIENAYFKSKEDLIAEIVRSANHIFINGVEANKNDLL